MGLKFLMHLSVMERRGKFKVGVEERVEMKHKNERQDIASEIASTLA